jgi:hypothetical protein
VQVPDAWFIPSRDIGAFADENWAVCWTALDEYGYFGDLVSAVDDPSLSATDETIKAYPNPATTSITVEFELSSAMELQFNVVDMTGKSITTIPSQRFEAGFTKHELDVHAIPAGMFLLTIRNESGIIGRRIYIKA